MEFVNLKNLQSLALYHKNGGELFNGLEVTCEASFRGKLKKGKLKSWVIGSVKMDLTQLGKYSESSTIVEVDGKEEKWPFTMLYVKK